MQSSNSVIHLDLGYKPSSVSGPHLYCDDNTTLLMFGAVPLSNPSTREVPILLRFPMCMIHKLGYPNDEALPGHPLYSAFPDNPYYEILEVLNSSWRAEVIRANEKVFPETPKHYFYLRHFIITFHESIFECLANDIVVEAATSSFEDAIRKLHAK